MATRYSGTVRIGIVYDDRSDQYRVTFSREGKSLGGVWVKPPAARVHAVDSPLAYDATARAGCSFMADDQPDVGQLFDSADAGYTVRRTKTYPAECC